MGYAKYFVWGEGVWRELDVSSGRVSGWRRGARFVFVRRGRLQVARRRTVLRALRALAAGQPSAAADGPRLSHRSTANRRHEAADEVKPVCHCCEHLKGCNNNMYTRGAYPWPPAPPLLPAPPAHVSAGTQCGQRDAGTNTTHTHLLTISVSRPPEPPHSLPSSSDEHVRRRALPAPRSDTSDVNSLLGKPKPTHGNKPPTVDVEKISGNDVDSRRSNHKHKPGPRSARSARGRHRTRSASSDEQVLAGSSAAKQVEGSGVCKELIIPEGDVAALRGFVARTRPTALQRFDADDAYKRALFYAINPLVELQRCAALDAQLHERRPAALPHFAARLGLTPRSSVTSSPSRAARRRTLVRYRERSDSASDTDKENKDAKNTSVTEARPERGVKKKPSELRATASEPVVRATRTSGARPTVSEHNNKKTRQEATEDGSEARGTRASGTRLGEAQRGNQPTVSDDSDDAVLASKAVQAPVATHTISKRASASGAKEYSNLEDHAIVAWVSGGSRASLVNGNRLWRELQDQYLRLTGKSRSWHSLRNRYLRYILPSLGALRLPPADVSRLRAAAATGAIKSKHRSAGGAAGGAAARRNSIFSKQPPLRGASSRPPRPRPRPRRPHTPHAHTRTPQHSSSDDERARPPATSELVNGPSSSRRSLRSGAQERDDSNSRPARSGAQERDGDSARPARSGAQERDDDSARPARSPRYSEVTRRFAARHAPSTSSSRVTSPGRVTSPPPPHAARSRRLFNPNANA